MPNKNLTGAFFVLVVLFLQHFCSAQDTLSTITFYGEKDFYQNCIGEEFVKINNRYRTGIRHGLYCIYDLVFEDNKLESENDTLFFVNRHIYHVVSPSVYGKVSMIIVPYDDTVFAFVGLNCCKKKHDVEDVIHWVVNKFPNVAPSTLANIRNYYVFHPNIPTDPQGTTPKCELRCLRHPSHRHYHYRQPEIVCRSRKNN